MSGKKPKKAKPIRDQAHKASDSAEAGAKADSDRLRQKIASPAVVRTLPADESGAASLMRVREVLRPRLMLFLSLTYVVWLGLLVWLASSIS